MSHTHCSQYVQPSTPSIPTLQPVGSRRLLSLDAFRGLTIALMLLVNNISLGAQTPVQLRHADWSGAVHVADWVFPWFLLIVGVAVPFAHASARKRRIKPGQYRMKAVQRAIVLVGLGCLLASLQARGLVWTLGVLQLIGLAYLCAAWAGTWLGVRGRAMLAILLLAAHTALLAYYRVPGVPVGTLSEHANVVNHLNQAYLAPLGLKGLISVIPATAMVLIGTLAGDFLRRKRISRPLKVAGLAGAGLALWGIGVWWSAYLTLNKALWTGSYIVYTAGLGLCTLAALYLLFDAPKGIGGKATRLLAFPFVVFGTNAIVAYVAPIAFKLAVLQRFEIAHPTGTIVNLERALQEWCYAQVGRIPGGWLYTISYIAAWWLVLLVLYRKRWFLRA